MTDSLTIFGVDYTGVTGIKATQTNDGELTYIRPSGTKSITQNGSGIDVAEYASVDVSVSSGTDTSDATATAGDIAQGKTAYAQGSKITGTIPVVTEHTVLNPPNVGSQRGASSAYYVNGLSVQYTAAQEAAIVPGNIRSGATILGVAGTYSGNDFVVTLAYNDQTELWEPDKTLAEIDAAYSDGKSIVAQTTDNYAARGQYDEFSSAYYYTIDHYEMDSVTYEVYLASSSYYLDSTGVHADLSTNYYDSSWDTATASDVASGKTFHSSGGYQTGTYVTPTARTSSDVTVSGDTVTVPAGAYASQVTKSVAAGTAGTPTATKGAVSNHAVSVTPSVTNSTGYITGGTKTGTAVSVSASELVSGTLSITGSGTADVTNYASASVAAGSASAPSTISGTSATVSTGTNTLTLSKTVSVTPTVSAGYVSSGTATNSAVSLTASVTTQAAQTIYPSASDQTIAASRYLTGAQTIKGVAVANLTAANIKSGVTVTVGDSSDADRVLSVTGTYSGGSSKNVQVAQSTTRVASTTYTKTASLTCSTSGKYDVYWDCFRSSTSGTNGSQLYIGGSAYGDANTTWASSSVNTQTNHLTNVQINANQEVAVYVRSRGTSYYASCGQLTIVQSS